jgi:hypothetical protein
MPSPPTNACWFGVPLDRSLLAPVFVFPSRERLSPLKRLVNVAHRARGAFPVRNQMQEKRMRTRSVWYCVGRRTAAIVDNRRTPKAANLCGCVAPVSGQWIHRRVSVRLERPVAEMRLTFAATLIKSITKFVYPRRIHQLLCFGIVRPVISSPRSSAERPIP